MSLPSFATQTVTVVRPTLLEERGTLVADWSDPTLLPVRGCLVVPGSGDVDADRRTAIAADATVYMPAGTDVLATDRVRLPGYARDFPIVGEPQRWAAGVLDHVVVRLQMWEG